MSTTRATQVTKYSSLARIESSGAERVGRSGIPRQDPAQITHLADMKSGVGTKVKQETLGGNSHFGVRAECRCQLVGRQSRKDIGHCSQRAIDFVDDFCSRAFALAELPFPIASIRQAPEFVTDEVLKISRDVQRQVPCRIRYPRRCRPEHAVVWKQSDLPPQAFEFAAQQDADVVENREH